MGAVLVELSVYGAPPWHKQKYPCQSCAPLSARSDVAILGIFWARAAACRRNTARGSGAILRTAGKKFGDRSPRFRSTAARCCDELPIENCGGAYA
jgi:hypothetical protein